MTEKSTYDPEIHGFSFHFWVVVFLNPNQVRVTRPTSGKTPMLNNPPDKKWRESHYPPSHTTLPLSQHRSISLSLPIPTLRWATTPHGSVRRRRLNPHRRGRHCPRKKSSSTKTCSLTKPSFPKTKSPSSSVTSSSASPSLLVSPSGPVLLSPQNTSLNLVASVSSKITLQQFLLIISPLLDARVLCFFFL